jgi:hypothetical protein
MIVDRFCRVIDYHGPHCWMLVKHEFITIQRILDISMLRSIREQTLGALDGHAQTAHYGLRQMSYLAQHTFFGPSVPNSIIEDALSFLSQCPTSTVFYRPPALTWNFGRSDKSTTKHFSSPFPNVSYRLTPPLSIFKTVVLPA